MIVFGPIPSRRLGRSLGINNIPPKICSYSCIYCQIGATDSMSIQRKGFFSPDEIYEEAAGRVSQLQKAGEKIDYLTFVPDGEPTLDINLGKTITRLKSFGIKIAVFTNSSLIWDKEVRNDLMKADWVSLKIDSAYENIWRQVNRPHGLLKLQNIIQGIKDFASSYKGNLVTETMLVKGINDNIESLFKTVRLITSINPFKSYILIPTRPPAERSVKPPPVENLNAAYQIFSSFIPKVELVVSNEGTDFTYSSDAEKELLGILAVHPMRKEAVEEFIKKAGTDNGFISSLIEAGILKKVQYNNNIYFIKNIRS